MATKKYTILRKDLYPTEEALIKVFEQYKTDGLDVEEEIKKLIDLGDIAENCEVSNDPKPEPKSKKGE